jgi:hypothetical protein
MPSKEVQKNDADADSVEHQFQEIDHTKRELCSHKSCAITTSIGALANSVNNETSDDCFDKASSCGAV